MKAQEVIDSIMQKPKRFFSWSCQAGSYRLTGGMDRRILQTRDKKFVQQIQTEMKKRDLLVDEESYRVAMAYERKKDRDYAEE